MATPVAGDLAPDFDLDAAGGSRFRLSGHLGRWVVLYFYPDDETEGCTIENREFSAAIPRFERLGVRVVGISPNDIATHCRFRDRYGLRSLLLADPDRIAIDAYGLWGSKTTFGHKHMGLKRTTFLIDPGGRVALGWAVRRIRGHAAEVLAAVTGMIKKTK